MVKHEINLQPYGDGVEADFLHTDKVTLAFWFFPAGTPVPEHAHANEQIVNMLEGQLELCIAGETVVLSPGAVAVIPPNATHSGTALTDCRVIDTFAPVRTEFAVPRDPELPSVND